MQNQEYIIQMKDIRKEYFGNPVLKGVNLNVKKGEIHALLGENGAGKSTLMNILFGMPVIHSTGGYQGEVTFDGQLTTIDSPNTAMNLGIGMVHQEFMLIPGFSITENIKLNREILKPNIFSPMLGDQAKTLDFKKMDQESQVSLDTLGLNLKVQSKVEGLPVGFMQFIEIAREIDKKNMRLMVFDEPTAVLTESEADTLLKAMRRIADSGISILFITHRLDDVMQVSDSITVLRDGEQVASLNTKDTNVIELAEIMVGRKIENMAQREEHESSKEVIMKIDNLVVDMPGEEVKGVNLEIKKGEILGIGGLAGQGKIGIPNGIMGIYPSKGSVTFNGQNIPLNNPAQSLKSKIAFVSEDRRGVGLLLDCSIEENIVLTSMQIQNKFIKNYGIMTQIDKKAIRAHALEMITNLDIRCTGPEQLTRRLSGGNQQKVCIARALTLDPEIIFVSEPTRGIDIGAKKLVLDTLVELNKRLGMTVVVISSELAELRSVCDRIAIVTEGKIEGILSPSDNDADFGLMMSGDYHKIHGKEVG